MKINKKLKYKNNPRRMTKKQFDLLKNHLEELGDLSGVIYCHNNKAYVGGNQRSEIFDGADIDIIEKFNKPTANKTIAYGFIKYHGEKFAYREVMFTEDEFRKACIVANNDGGEFDWDSLANEWDADELKEWGMDVPTNINNDIQEVDEINENCNFIIKCKDIAELESLQSKLDVQSLKINYETFILKAGL